MEMTEGDMLSIDGNLLEGGGQILRIASALSAILTKPIRVYNIRAGRDKPGLKAQHLLGIRLVRDFCDGILEGAELGSTEIVLRPRKLTAGKYYGDVRTAGSITLLIQSSLPCLLFAKGVSKLTLKGGTNVDMAPSIDYLIMVLKPIIERFGVKFSIDLRRRGFFPKGQGVVELTVESLSTGSGSLKPIELLNRGTLRLVTGLSYVAGVIPMTTTHSMANQAVTVLRGYHNSLNVVIDRKKFLPNEAVGNGCGILLVAETSGNCLLGSSALGNRSLVGDEIGTEAAQDMIVNLKHGGCVDNYLQDQLIIFMALAAGKSRIQSGPLTLHTQTAIHIAQLMTNAQFNILKDEADENIIIIECEGHGLNKTTN